MGTQARTVPNDTALDAYTFADTRQIAVTSSNMLVYIRRKVTETLTRYYFHCIILMSQSLIWIAESFNLC